MAGYDPKKAAAYNKLRQQGLSDEAAFQQSGITAVETDNYVVNDVPGDSGRGTIGPAIVGTGTITQTPTVAEQRESSRFYQGLESSNFERVDYPVKANSSVSNKTPITYTTTSTEQVSGGGSTTITSGLPKANAQSDSLQAQADIKTAEIARYNEENPVTRNSTPAQIAERRAVLGPLIAERNQLSNQAESAKTPTEPTTTTVPNTTTNVSTTTFSQESTNTPVQSIGGDDPVINQQQEQRAGLRIDQVNNAPLSVLEPGDSTSLPPVARVDISAPAEVVIDEPQNQPLLTQEQSIARAQSLPAGVDPVTAAADFNAETDQNVLNAIGVEQPAPVEPAVAPGADSPFGGAPFNDATARTPAPVDPTVDPAVAPGATSPFGGGAFNRAAAQNPEAVEAALQAAQEAQLRQQAAVQAEFQSPAAGDWRVRLRLAPGASYLYKDTDAKNGILAPLAASNGVVFPYMPTISTSYNANYDQTDLTHSNYRGQFYKSSYVGDIQISGEFTAQDTAEANYLLAVIHFFRSVTKMFYGAKDSFRGTPPPLVYLIGLGQYQFNNQPCVVRTFNYSMPNNVDYIRTKPNNYNVNLNGRQEKTQTGLNPIMAVIDRLRNAGLKKGALPNVPAQTLLDLQSVNNIDNSTYVPTRCEISITLMPIQTRDQQSTLFNMKDYASGQLLKGGFW